MASSLRLCVWVHELFESNQTKDIQKKAVLLYILKFHDWNSPWLQFWCGFFKSDTASVVEKLKTPEHLHPSLLNEVCSYQRYRHSCHCFSNEQPLWQKRASPLNQMLKSFMTSCRRQCSRPPADLQEFLSLSSHHFSIMLSTKMLIFKLLFHCRKF